MMATNTFNYQPLNSGESWRLGITRGELFVQRSNGERHNVREGDLIASGDTLYSRPQSAALIYGQDGSVLTFGSSTSLRFDSSIFERFTSKTIASQSGYSRYLNDLEELIANGGNIEEFWISPSSGGDDAFRPPLERISSSIFDEEVVFVWERSGNELIPSISLSTSDTGEVLSTNTAFNFSPEEPPTNRVSTTTASVQAVPASTPEPEPEPNNPPSSSADTYRAYKNTDLVVDSGSGVLTNDSDPEGDSLTVNTTPVVNVSNGTLTLNADGSFTYVPNNGFSGQDQFTYELIDSKGNTSQATAKITVAIEGTTGSDYQYWPVGSITDTVGDDLILPRGNTDAARDDISLANGGADTIAFESSDPYTSDSATWNSTGMFKITDFTLGDTSTNPEADALDLSDLLVTHDGDQVKMSSLTTEQQAKHIFFGGGKSNYNDTNIFVNVDGEYTDSPIGGSDNALDYLNDNDQSVLYDYRWGSSISAAEHATIGTDLIFEVKDVDIVNYASSQSLTLNTTDFLQHLKDTGAIILD